MSKMKKGINAWAFPADLSLEEIFKAAKQYRFDGLEINMGEASDGLSLTPESTESDYARILELSRTYNMPIPSVSTGLHWSYPLTSEDEAKREHGKLIVRKMIDAAAYFSADTILVVPGLVTPSVSYKTAYARSKASFLELKEYAQEKKVVIGVENVWNKFLLSPIEMAGFIDSIGSDYVKAYFDAGNVLQFSYPQHWVEVLGSRIAKVHIKDFDTSVGNMSGFRNLLQGDMDWNALMSSLEAAGYESYITAELSPYRTNPIQLIDDTSRAMDYILS